MNDKSHVSMEQHVCLVCGVAFDTGAILLDKRLRASMERNTVTAWGLCTEHQRLADQGFVALVECDPQVISRVRAQHRHQEFLDFLRQIDKQTPTELDLHLIVDNYVTHKHAKVKAWLARNPCVHPHFTPTYSSWLNQVGRWFALITERAIRRNSFTSVRELKPQIELFVQRYNATTLQRYNATTLQRYNATASPFQWVATAESILQKIERIAKRISATGH